MRNLYLVTKEDFKNLLRNPMWIFYATLFPVLLIIIMGFLTKDMYSATVSSYDYYGVALMIYTIFSSGMTSANAFMEVKVRKPNMRIIYATGSAKVIFLAKILSSFVFCSLFHLLDIAVLTAICHINLGSNIQSLILLLLFGELFSVTLGVMMCCIFKTEATANQIQSIIVNLFCVLGGIFYSLDGFGSFARHISMISPAKWMMDTSFQIIYDNSFKLFVPVLMFLGITTIIMLVMCNVNFKKEDCLCLQ